MSELGTKDPKLPRVERMEAMSSTRGASQGEPCANPVQAEAPAGAGTPINYQDASVDTRSLVVEGGIIEVVPTVERGPGKVMEVLGIILTPGLDSRGGTPTSSTPVTSAFTPTGTESRRTDEKEDLASTPPAMRNTLPGTPVVAQRAQDGPELCLGGDQTPILAGRAFGVEGQIPCAQNPDLVQSVQRVAIVKLS